MYLDDRDPGSLPKDKASPAPFTVRTRRFCEETPTKLHIRSGFCIARISLCQLSQPQPSNSTSLFHACAADFGRCQVKLWHRRSQPKSTFSKDKRRTQTSYVYTPATYVYQAGRERRREKREMERKIKSEQPRWEEATLNCQPCVSWSIELHSLDLFSGSMNVHFWEVRVTEPWALKGPFTALSTDTTMAGCSCAPFQLDESCELCMHQIRQCSVSPWR